MKLLKFYSKTCGPCKALDKTLALFSTLPVEVVSIDVEENPLTAAKHNVRAVPTLVLVSIETDAEVRRHRGNLNAVQLMEFING
jgi:thiol-disulfide isomerase/thioredoxin